MAHLLVLQHSVVGAARLGATLRDHAFKLDVRKPNLTLEEGGHQLPPDLDEYQGLICLGGPPAPDSDEQWMLDEMDLIREAHDRDLPLIGICLGHQLIARALGGKVGKMAKPEWGFNMVDLTPQGQVEPMFGGIPWSTPRFQSHAYEVTELPEGATLLASNEHCKVQAFKAGQRTFGFQYHFEADGPLLEYFEEVDKELMEGAGVTSGQFREQAIKHYDMFARAADRLCVNIVTYAFPYKMLTSI